MEEELRKIRKLYGEKMMKLCRSLFPEHLGKNNLLLNTLYDRFAPTHQLYNDIVSQRIGVDSFQKYINGIINGNQQSELVETDKTPFELLDEAGYTLYECHNERDIQSFKHFFKSGEELCTFNGGRLKRCHVFFAVKKDVDKIKREDFPNPQREDLYGTSVISIQLTKGDSNFVSIKNRYNHTVDNPDATFYNNLERIIPGLTYSFNKYYGLSINTDEKDFSIPINVCLRQDYARSKNGRYYKYNVENNAIYFCENNYIICDRIVFSKYVNDKNSNRYLIIDDIVVDFLENRLFTLDAKKKRVLENGKRVTRLVLEEKSNAFTKSITDVGIIKRIEVKKTQSGKDIYIRYDHDKVVTIRVNNSNGIKEYINNYVNSIDNNFLNNSKTLVSLELNNVIDIGDHCLEYDSVLTNLSISKVKRIGKNSFVNAYKITKLSFDELLELKDGCFSKLCRLHEFNAPKLKVIGDDVFEESYELTSISLPSVEAIGNGFRKCVYSRCIVSEFVEIRELSNIKKIGNCFLGYPKRVIVYPELIGLSSNKTVYDFKDFMEVLANEKKVNIDSSNFVEVHNNLIRK